MFLIVDIELWHLDTLPESWHSLLGWETGCDCVSQQAVLLHPWVFPTAGGAGADADVAQLRCENSLSPLQLAAPEINYFFHWKIVAIQFRSTAFQTGTSVRFSCCQCFVMWNFLFIKSKVFTKQASQSPSQFKKYISGSAFLKSSWGML